MTGKDKKVRGEEFKIDTTCTLASKKILASRMSRASRFDSLSLSRTIVMRRHRYVLGTTTTTSNYYLASYRVATIFKGWLYFYF